MILEYLAIALLLIYSIASSYFCLKFAMTVLRVQDQIEKSLDVIDEQYSVIEEILKRPLFYDSPEVRKVLDSIAETRDTILLVASTLSSNFNSEDNEEESEEELEG